MAISRKKRFEILKRDNFKCVYCGAKPDKTKLEIDHVAPKCKGGGDLIKNLVTACHECNIGKAGHELKKTKQMPVVFDSKTSGKTLFISITKELKTRVVKYSKDTGIPISKVIKFALIQYLDKRIDSNGKSTVQENFPQLLGSREWTTILLMPKVRTVLNAGVKN